ncbi:uncharacterized protein [Bemisia tabaci]
MASLGYVIFLSLFILGPAFCQPTTDQECSEECGRRWGSIDREGKTIPIKTGQMGKGPDGKPECECLYSGSLYFVIRKAGHDLKEFQKEEQDFGKAISWLRQNGFKLAEDPACDEQCKKDKGSIVEGDPPTRVPMKTGGRMEVNKDGQLKCKCTYSQDFYSVLERAGKSVTAFKECEFDDQAAKKWLMANGFERRVTSRDNKTPSGHPTTKGKEVISEEPEVEEWVQSKGKAVQNEENPPPAKRSGEELTRMCHAQCRRLMGLVDFDDGVGKRPLSLGKVKSYRKKDSETDQLKCHCGLNSQVLEILRKKGRDLYKIKEAFKGGQEKFIPELLRQGLTVYLEDGASPGGYKELRPQIAAIPPGQPSSSGGSSTSSGRRPSRSDSPEKSFNIMETIEEGEEEEQPPSPRKKTRRSAPLPGK